MRGERWREDKKKGDEGRRREGEKGGVGRREGVKSKWGRLSEKQKREEERKERGRE